VFRIIPSTIFSLQSLNAPPVLATFGNYTSACASSPRRDAENPRRSRRSWMASTRPPARFILTLEDPIEFLYTPKQSVIVQREVGVDGLPSPRIAPAIPRGGGCDRGGEIPDRETMTLAMQAAEAVFGLRRQCRPTRHQNHYRIVDLFPQSIRWRRARRWRWGAGRLHAITRPAQRRRGAHRRPRGSSANPRRGEYDPRGQNAATRAGDALQQIHGKCNCSMTSSTALLREGLITGEEAYYNAYDKDRFARYASGRGAGEASL
jgi:hypothetical protein